MKIILNELLPVTSIKIQPILNEYIDQATDLLSIDQTEVEGNSYWNNESQKLRLSLNIKANLSQACSITLLPVVYPINIDVSILFSTEDDEKADYVLENEIDLAPYIYAEIFANKKYRVFHESADRTLYEEADDSFQPFANLEEDLKKTRR